MPIAAAPRMAAQDWAALGFLSMLWGGSFFFIENAVAEIPPLTLVFLRVALAAACLQIVCRLAGLARPEGRRWVGFFLLLGLVNNVLPFALLFWAQTRINASLASILNASTPIFAALLTPWLIGDERLTAARLGGVLVGVTGVTVMLGGGLGPAMADGTGLAELAVIGASLCYALGTILGRRFLGPVAPLTSAAWQLTAAAILVLPAALLVQAGQGPLRPSAAALGAVAGLALASTALAYLIFYRLLARAGATNLTLVTMLVPVSAIFLGVLFLGERLEPRHGAGLAMIAGGLALIDGRLMDLLRRRKPTP